MEMGPLYLVQGVGAAKTLGKGVQCSKHSVMNLGSFKKGMNQVLIQ